MIDGHYEKLTCYKNKKKAFLINDLYGFKIWAFRVFTLITIFFKSTIYQCISLITEYSQQFCFYVPETKNYYLKKKKLQQQQKKSLVCTKIKKIFIVK
jgi:hypothetical protein